MHNKLALLFGLMFPALVSATQPSPPAEHRIWIETSSANGRLLAEPRVEAGHDALLDYELISTKVGHAGRSESRQAGSARLAAGETRALSRLTLSVAGDDHYILSLRVYEHGQVVGEDTITYPR